MSRRGVTEGEGGVTRGGEEEVREERAARTKS